MEGRTDLTYDRIGSGYPLKRQTDERLAQQIRRALGDADSIVNVGAGSGSYEPVGIRVVGVEPATTMIRLRGTDAAPVVRGRAEALPFAADAFAAALAILTIHHWADWRAGLREMVRVARKRVVIFTWDPASDGFWIRDYMPDLIDRDRRIFPALSAIQGVTGASEVIPIPIPHDCLDGFLGAYWRRPASYHELGVRQAISSLATRDADVGLARLAADLDNGEWARVHAGISKLPQLDVGYRLLVTTKRSRWLKQL